MNGSREELEKRVKAAEKVLRDMEKALESARALIEETRRILDDAQTNRKRRIDSQVKQPE